jgi:O-antigen/teichoic acid export membrane protein/LmbE family N-acetylglucosaminyl deacetylase
VTAVPPSSQTAPDDAQGAVVDVSAVPSRSVIVSASVGIIGVLGYAGTVVMAHLLEAAAFSDFVAAAMLLGIVGTFAAALVPMPLIHVIRHHPRHSEGRRRGLSFAWMVSGLAGVLAAVITGAVTVTFATPVVAAAVAVSALALFACSPIWAWLYGELRFVRAAALQVAEVAARIVFSVVVVLLGWSAGGALLGFAFGVVVVLLGAPWAMHRDLAWRPDALRERERWTETGSIAFAQLIASTLVGADVVLVAVLGAPATEGAGYQALSTLAKGPVYVAAGAAVVAFPLLRSKSAQLHDILTATLRSFALLAFPAAAVVATAPTPLILLVLPDRYTDSIRLLPTLAAAGVGYAAITMLTTVLLGLRAYRRCQTGLVAAVVLLPAGMLLGWEIGSLPGLAVGAAIGAVAGGAGMAVAAAPLLPDGTFRSAVAGLAATAALFGLLFLARPVPVLWALAVLLLGVLVLRQLRRRPVPAPADASRSRTEADVGGMLAARLDRVTSTGGSFLFVSPHLDDAALSCGALMASLVTKAPVTVVTLFSAAGPPPHTRATLAYLAQCAASSAAELYTARRQEDAEVLGRLGAEFVHLDIPDALFRRRQVSPLLARAARLLPELAHRYPTYRFDIAKGRLSRGEGALVDTLEARIRELADQTGAGLIFFPLGVGRHIDHLLARAVGKRLRGRVVYYSDFPYDQLHGVDRAFVARHRLRRVSWRDGMDRKLELINGYRSQVDALFPEGDLPVVPDTYFLPEA